VSLVAAEEVVQEEEPVNLDEVKDITVTTEETRETYSVAGSLSLKVPQNTSWTDAT
jgi:hypothetical protein